MTSPLLVEVRGNVQIMTLNRPEARNAATLEMSEAMVAALDALDADPALSVGIITGAGGSHEGAAGKLVAGSTAAAGASSAWVYGRLLKVSSRPVVIFLKRDVPGTADKRRLLIGLRGRFMLLHSCWWFQRVYFCRGVLSRCCRTIQIRSG